MTADLTRADKFVRDALVNDGLLNTAVGGRIYGDYAPQGATYPLVIFAYLGGADKLRTRTSRLTSTLYLIRAVAEGSSFDAIEAAADRIDVVMHIPDTGVLVRDIRVTSVFREQPHQRKDEENGVPVVYLGGFYRVVYQTVDQ